MGSRWKHLLPALALLWLAFGLMALRDLPDPGKGAFPHGNELLPRREGLPASETQPFWDKQRDFWQKPEQVLELLGPLEGLQIADIGCGDGYFTLRLLERVGEGGRVFASDIQPQALEKLARRVPQPLAKRLQLVLASATDPGMEGTFDLIFLVQVLGEVGDQRAFLTRVRDLMGAHTRLVIIDSRHGTDGATGYAFPLDMHALTRELRGIGLVGEQALPPESLEFLPKQFLLVLRKGEDTEQEWSQPAN
jgi:SAM-dependent methyltransferase